MSSTPNQNDRRDEFGMKIHEFKSRGPSAADWKKQFEDHPEVYIGVALVGGALLAVLAGSYMRGRRTGLQTSSSPSPIVEKAAAAFATAKSALLGLAITRFRDYADSVLPGFSEHYQKAANDNFR
jgi:hypothetical protein